MEYVARILDGSTGEYVEAFVRPAEPSDRFLWSRWHGEMPADAEDAHWEWDALLDLAAAVPSLFEAYALIAEDELQGLRLLRLETGQLGLHAERLSIAPWNRPPQRRYRRVGRVLVAAAILRSIELGCEGRFYCESLPDAEDFHRSNGMLQVPDRSPEGLARFSMSAEGGRRFLEELAEEGLINID